ncbi:MAG: TolA-binding protein [Cyclobacteriaceae bacterium]
MKHRHSFLLSLFLVILLSISCAPERKNLISNTFHNTTAHYNAYFYANERVKEIQLSIEENFDWNFNKILPVFAEFDTTLATSMASQIDDCIKKSSIAIQRHPESSWEQESYILVGMAYYLSSDFPNAITAFKHVNVHSDNDNTRHKAVVALLKTYLKMGEMKNAVAVSDFLKKEKLNKRNLKNLYLSRAYMYQKREDLNFMVQNLTQAEPLITDHEERARISFIIGQVYQQLAFNGEAYQYYKKTLGNNPGYELSFYTKLNMAQVTELAKSNDLKKVRKYFKGLLNDAKNVDFRDKIYYEMANFEVKHGNLEEGMEYYRQSVQASTKNKRQKAYSYLSLGKIYYDSLANYKLAKLYYDSTISVLPQDELEYQKISERQIVLEDFVKQLTVIHDNDSLLALSELSVDSLNLFLDDYIAEKEAKELDRKEKAAAKEKRSNNSVFKDPFNDEFIPIGSNNFGETVWYFYNQSAIDKGRFEFTRVWGDRILEDNWRRSNKTLQSNNEVSSEQTAPQTRDNEDPIDADDGPKIDKNALIATIPYEEEKKIKLLSEVEIAHYNLGNIYNFSLEEKSNAAVTFENLLSRFEESDYKLEVMYLLYLIYMDLGDMSKSDYYKNILLDQHPNSVYAKIILNPNYREESEAASGKLKNIYAQAYRMFRAGDYEGSLITINQGIRIYPDNDFVDNANLLKILLTGRMESIYQYQYELNDFIRTYSESELLPYADSLVKASENFQINLVNSTKAKFWSDLNKPHHFVFVFPNNSESQELLLSLFDELISKEGLSLTAQSLILDEDKTMILVPGFKDRKSAMNFNKIVDKVDPASVLESSGKSENIIITLDNFNILFRTKEIDTYMKFYRKNYQIND